MRRLGILVALVAIFAGVQGVYADVQDPNQLADATVDKALAFLKSKQKPDFGWQDEADPPGVTALVLRAFIADHKYDASQAFLQGGYGKLLSYQVGNGGIYKDMLACYNTAISISALADAKKPEYRTAMLKALDYLHQLQWSDKIAGVPDQLRSGQR